MNTRDYVAITQTLYGGPSGCQAYLLGVGFGTLVRFVCCRQVGKGYFGLSLTQLRDKSRKYERV